MSKENIKVITIEQLNAAEKQIEPEQKYLDQLTALVEASLQHIAEAFIHHQAQNGKVVNAGHFWDSVKAASIKTMQDKFKGMYIHIL
jgi:hypothetical protein